MFADRLLDKWPLITNPFHLDPSAYSEWTQQMAISDALRVQVDNVREYIYGLGTEKMFHENDFVNCRPASHWTWYEWTDKHANGGTVNIGVLVGSEEIDDYIGNCATVYYERLGGKVIYGGAFGWDTDVLGNMLSVRIGINRSNPDYTKSSRNLMSGIAPTLLMSITFMNCKNVTLNQREASVKEQKSRQRQNRRPLMRYHTLEIKPMTRALSVEGNIDKNGIKQALHICRGHFKDYRETGLFGKHKGLYWWDSHVRGNESEGVVVKDYIVSPDK